MKKYLSILLLLSGSLVAKPMTYMELQAGALQTPGLCDEYYDKSESRADVIDHLKQLDEMKANEYKIYAFPTLVNGMCALQDGKFEGAMGEPNSLMSKHAANFTVDQFLDWVKHEGDYTRG